MLASRPCIFLVRASNIDGKTSLPAGSILVEERIGAKLVRRYLVDCKKVKPVKESSQSKITSPNTTLLDFFLPAGFPDSVTGDYLKYMLWQLPTNITGWMCRALITSSLLQAVGLTAGPGPTAAAAAAIKWVSKDGLGAVGRLFIGGRFGGVFDEDPKQWRMFAELVGSFGGLFELATPLAPAYFLPLASLGYLTKAVAKALKEPSFRVIQNHFSIAENVGDVAAKEEVWEVAGQLLGLALGVALLSTPVIATSYSQLALSWGIIRSFHLWLRYQSLSALELPTLNYKRMSILICQHVQGTPLSGVSECNAKENLMMPRQLMKPSIQIGCSWQDVFSSDSDLAPEINEALSLYHAEDYVLVPTGMNTASCKVLFKDSAGSMTIMRSMYQAYALFLLDDACDLVKSLAVMQRRLPSFVSELERAGWKSDKMVVRLPSGAPTYSFKLD